MSRPQGYTEGEVFESRPVKSNRGSKVTVEKLALMALCLLLASALVVTYLLSELLKTRETIRNLQVKLETVKSDVTVQPTCPPQPTCPMQPEVKMNTKPFSTGQPTSPQPPAVTDDPCFKCEDDWEQHGGKCYHFSTRTSSWNESRAECISEGGDLVQIDSLEEQSFLRKTIQHKTERCVDKFWIGLTDSAAEGSWVWVDGSPLNESLARWSFPEPDNWPVGDPDGEDCAMMGPVYISDRSCKIPEKSICEKAAESVCVSDRPEGPVSTIS